MTVKLLLLKSGEDIIADISEMVFGEKNEETGEDNRRVVGYFLNKPCVVKMTTPTNVPEKFDESMDEQKASFKVTLFPWMPLSKDNVIPVSADWVVTMVTPSDKLNNMYLEDVLNYGKEDNKNFTSTEQPDSDNSN
jgi:hypothetical protein